MKLRNQSIIFRNTTDFAVDRWGDIREAIEHSLSPDCRSHQIHLVPNSHHSDRNLASKCSDREALAREIDIKHGGPESPTTAKRQLGKVTQLPKVMDALA